MLILEWEPGGLPDILVQMLIVLKINKQIKNGYPIETTTEKQRAGSAVQVKDFKAQLSLQYCMGKGGFTYVSCKMVWHKLQQAELSL